MDKKIWYISKYALNTQQGGPSRQYLFSKYFAIKGFSTTLISSNSNGYIHFKFNGKHKEFGTGKFKHFVLKGGKIALGFNLKRIVSWFLFEYRVLKFFKKEPIKRGDIVIVSSLSILTFLTGIYLKRKFKAKLIVEVRDIWPLTLIEFKKISKYNPFIMVLSLIEKAGYKNADNIVGSMVKLDEHIKVVAPNNELKFRYIPMGFDESILGQQEHVNDSKNDSFIVGYAGSIGRANRVDIILECADLLKDNANIKFEILGEGPLKNSFIEKYGELEHLKFLPKVEKKMVNNFLSKCDILVNPWDDQKIYRFGVSPNKWIDYMYAEKPIIVSYNGHRNIINEAGCGEFIETNNAALLANTILKYSCKPKVELKEIGKRGRLFLDEKLSYNVLVEEYIKIFE